MRVHIGADHAGWGLSHVLISELKAQGYEAVTHMSAQYDEEDDYPAFCLRVARAVRAEKDAGLNTLGVVIGGSGNGEQIAANKVSGIRAALVWNKETAILARQHNDASIMAIGARQHQESEALALVFIFLTGAFSNAERHLRRIQQVSFYENSAEIVSVA